MDSLNDLLYPKGGRQIRGDGNGDGNEMQVLFYDLLACLAGDDHPMLPQGYKQKPMTGFSAILDAFNESNKIHESGSSLIEEVGSKDFIDAKESQSTTVTVNQAKCDDDAVIKVDENNNVLNSKSSLVQEVNSKEFLDAVESLSSLQNEDESFNSADSEPEQEQENNIVFHDSCSHIQTLVTKQHQPLENIPEEDEECSTAREISQAEYSSYDYSRREYSPLDCSSLEYSSSPIESSTLSPPESPTDL